MRSPAEPDLALGAGLQPEDAQERAALAGAVGADQANDFPLVDPQVDAVEHLRAVVEGVQATDLQHRRICRRGRRR